MNPIKRYFAYGLIVLFLITGGFGVASWIRTQQLQLTVKEEKAKQEKLIEANSTLTTAVDTLKKVRESDTAVLEALSRDLSGLAEKDSRVNKKLELLEKNDANFRALLATVLPAGGCMLDDSCKTGDPSGSGQGQTTGKPAGTVSNAADRAIRNREGSGPQQPR